jgi:amino acid transporter
LYNFEKRSSVDTAHKQSAIPQGNGGVVEYATSRPRVLGWLRSAAFLDGDWGTSIAYVLGIGFALGGYTSFWHLMMMLALTALVALNYMTICRLYPNGGGVYSSVYHRSRTFAVIGALLLGADYVITMSLSILEAAHYFGLENAPIWAIAFILCIATLNWFGPKQTGGVALFISISTILSLATIVVVSSPAALTFARVEPPTGGFFHNWGIFAAIILSISGIESISNMTGLMKDPVRDSRRAIFAVLSKITIVTVFLTLAMHAVPGLEGRTEDMLRFLGEHYVGHWFGWVVGLALGLLLLSAGNTAMNGLVNIQFLMSVDKELPRPLRRLNRHGMPIIPLIVAMAAPVIVLLIVHDVLILAHLYAIGVVGAILINIGSTATDSSLSLPKKIKTMMIVSAVVLFFVEISIVIEKPDAALFAGIVLLVGLSARQLARHKIAVPVPSAEAAAVHVYRRVKTGRKAPTTKMLVAMKDKSDRLLRFAIEEAKARNALLYILRIKEIAVGSLPERLELYANGDERRIAETLDAVDVNYHIISIPSYEVGYTIAEQAAILGVDRVILGATQRGVLEKALKGSVMQVVGSLLPEEIQLLIFG